MDLTPLIKRRTGIAVCTQELFLATREAGHAVVGLVGGWFALHEKTAHLRVPLARNWVPSFLNPLFLDRLGWPAAETLLGQVDAYVATNYNILPARRAVNVAIIHDVGRLTHPGFFGRRQVIRFGYQVRRCARLAEVIVVPSQAVADEILALGLAEASRIEVMHLGARELIDSGTRPPALETPYLLCVGTLERRKNVRGLLGAFARAAPRIPHHLVVAGADGAGAEEIKAAAAATDRVHLAGHVDHDELGRLYRGADFAVCPSFYEGFGLTLLEAMAAGCAVLASDIPPHREVGGDAARFVPADDEAAFARGLEELARDEGARAELCARGRERARRFTWERTRQRFTHLLSERCARS
jgi:glycosyltransferase involved in cell wall biosynthesis